MKKGDYIVIFTIVIVFILSIIMVFSFSKQGSRVIIKQSGKIVYDQNIYKNATFDTGTNIVIIKDGAVYMDSASCKNQICVKSRKISKKGESIICLPNKVIVEIK